MIKIFLFTLLLPFSAPAHQCRDLFTAVHAQRTRSLTQVYIHRNSQFPLHSNLIQMALAADIVINRISADMPIDYVHTARALNNLHQKYSVPVRVAIPGEPSPQGPWRTIPMQYLEDTISTILHDNFSILNQWGYLTPLLNSRQLLFWQTIQSFFDSSTMGYLSEQYKTAISDSTLSGKDILKFKEYYLKLLIEELYSHLSTHLPGGLQAEERFFLSSSLIL